MQMHEKLELYRRIIHSVRCAILQRYGSGANSFSTLFVVIHTFNEELFFLHLSLPRFLPLSFSLSHVHEQMKITGKTRMDELAEKKTPNRI